MKKFCRCNIDQAVIKTPGTDNLQLCGDELRNEHWEIFCKTCGFYKWLDPFYENIMFSLKEMNRC